MVRSVGSHSDRLSTVFPEALRFGGIDVRLSSVCCEAQHVREGDIYVALLGAERDGHDDVFEAVRRGAAAVVVERYLPVQIPQYQVADTREAFGRLCQHLVGTPQSRMPAVGITGSHGKTTVALLIASIFKAAGAQAGWSTTLGWSDSLQAHPAPETTPVAPELARRLADMHAARCDAALVEVTSQALAERRVAGIAWDVAVLTNLRRAHLDLHGNVHNYRRAMLRLLAQRKDHGAAVVNVDDPATRKIIDGVPGRVLTIGMRQSADVTATLIERHRSEQMFLLNVGHHCAAVRTRQIGDHHIYNCLAAAAAALALGVDVSSIVHGLERLEHIPGRLERIECGQPFGVFIDDAQCPDRLAVTLKGLREVTPGRLICVYGPQHHQPSEVRPLLGRVVERHADVGIITSNDPGDESPLAIAHDILDGYVRPGRAQLSPDRQRAIVSALESSRQGDCVLIAGKGARLGQQLADRTLPFDDADVARQWLYSADAPHQHATDDEPEPVILRIR